MVHSSFRRTIRSPALICTACRTGRHQDDPTVASAKVWNSEFAKVCGREQIGSETVLPVLKLEVSDLPDSSQYTMIQDQPIKPAELANG